MLLQTNSYLVPRDRRDEHARLMRRFAASFQRLGAHFEVFEQMGSGFSANDPHAAATRFVQMMRFRDARHQASVQAAESDDAVAQRLISDFCRLIDLEAQQRQGLYAGGFYTLFLAADSETQRQLPKSSPPRESNAPDEVDAPMKLAPSDATAD